MNIIFMGTPEFAAYSLKALLSSKHKILAVVTVPDKPAGRGLKLQMSAVKELALEHQLPVLQPTKLSEPDFIKQLSSYQAEVFVVIAFKKLPQQVWSIPPKGTINVHASLLPQYRGAAPINWAIINGEKQTGVTIFYINNEIDCGDIISFKEVPIPYLCTAGKLHDILMYEGADLLLQTLDDMEQGIVEPIRQQSFVIKPEELKPAPKITPEICELDWSKKANEIVQWIYGLSPYPAAFIRLKNKIDDKIIQIKILDAELIDGKHESPPKTIITDNKSYWYIAADGGLIQINECKPEGRKAMNVRDFLNGFRNLNDWEII